MPAIRLDQTILTNARIVRADQVMEGGVEMAGASSPRRALATAGLLDIVSSDYIPFAMLQSACCLVDTVEGKSVPDAKGLVTRRPAEAVGPADRGEIALGKRVDLMQHRLDGVPIVRTMWRQGRRVS
ncbi:alpha-D-ribose 1-methylphosphonate 5-triphosphate diphosphatase PhnM [Devosia subaequoris]|uniref:Alpha-D-ribose 1-methylphosphonate 5-triphosphate diphosphatase PhnM n=1 Tax=Devosia subaequoris TaxID=395930 RepID=A0A7W6NBV2_9HYPH|nr:hypothetical protein [Devosia subaequoris]MBB4052076.1 alpha-D-ribose 1-methylphosphonate 5-triphosphate diphosphatase PhnM [Devosia subaequoris]MCP1210239.1 hypothetical protein [Devosia subaequoris]